MVWKMELRFNFFKVIENLFNEITAENFPSLGKYMDIQAQEIFRITNRHLQRKISP